MKRNLLCGLSVLAVCVLLALPETAHAQRGGRGGGWSGGRGWSGGGYGGRGWDGGYGGWYGNRGYYGGYGFGLSFGSPYYGSNYYGNNYYSDSSYPSYSYSYPADTTSSYQSFYRAPSNEPSNAARLRVMVPGNARVWLQDQETTPQGMERLFYSPSLTPGQEYIYTVRAQWTDANGRPMDQTRQVRVKANDTVNVDFMTAQSQPTTSGYQPANNANPPRAIDTANQRPMPEGTQPLPANQNPRTNPVPPRPAAEEPQR